MKKNIEKKEKIPKRDPINIPVPINSITTNATFFYNAHRGRIRFFTLHVHL